MLVKNWDDVPEFTSEEDEQEFWAEHDLGKALLDQMTPVSLEDGLNNWVGIEGAANGNDFAVNLELPKDIILSLCSWSQNPRMLKFFESVVIFYVRLVHRLPDDTAVIHELRQLDQELKADMKRIDVSKTLVEDDEGGWLDYLNDGLEAMADCQRLLKSISESTELNTERIKEETKKLTGISGNSNVSGLLTTSALRAANFINEHADNLKRDADELKQSIVKMSSNSLRFIDFLKEQQGNSEDLNEFLESIASLQESILFAIEGTKQYRESTKRLYGIKRELTKAAAKLTEVLQQILDTLSEIKAFTELALGES
jgi:hypothetical protein